MNSARYLVVAAVLLVITCSALGLHAAEPPAVLPATEPLTLEGDIASRLVDGVDRFLLAEIDKSVERRGEHWNRDRSSPKAYQESIEPNRQRLAHILGVRDERVPFDGLELIGTTARPPLVGQGNGYKAFAVRWPAFGDVHGEGLLLVPDAKKGTGLICANHPPGRSGRLAPSPFSRVADVIAIPDADQTPEMLAGLSEGVAYLLDRSVEAIASHEQALVKTMLESLTEWGEMPGFTLYGPQGVKHRCGVFSVRIDGLEPHELSAILETQYGILTRSGLHCAPGAHATLGTTEHGGTTRLSFGPFLSTQEVKYAADALGQICHELASSRATTV
jgi:hypothetical protein